MFKKLKCISVTRISQLMTFSEEIALCFESITKHKCILCAQYRERIGIKADDKHSYHSTIKI
jgi:hypothetical protein